MNTTQKQVVGWGLALFVAMAIFPPWTVTLHPFDPKIEYGFLFNPPYASTVCITQLGIQWFVLAVLFAGLFVLNKGPEAEQKVEAPPQKSSRFVIGAFLAVFLVPPCLILVMVFISKLTR